MKRVTDAGWLLACGLLAVAVAAMSLRENDDVLAKEQREANPLPNLRVDAVRSWERYPMRFEAFLQDNLGFRESWLLAHRWIFLNVFGVSPSPKVLIGDDGWLFLWSNHAPEAVLPNDLEASVAVEKWARHVEDLEAGLAARGMIFQFVVAPNKHTIYGEHLPWRLGAMRKTTRLDLLMDRLKRSPVKIVDLRPPLLQEKQHADVYWRNDSHWNDRGAFVAYKVLMSDLSRRLPEVFPPWRRSDFGIKVQGTRHGDLAHMIGVQKRFAVPREIWRPRRKRLATLRKSEDTSPSADRNYDHVDQALPSALVFRDSYFTGLKEYYAEHFRHMMARRRAWVDLDVADQLKPTVVVFEISERYLQRNPPGIPNDWVNPVP